MYNAGEPFWDRTWRLIREIWPLGHAEELKDRVQPHLPDSDIGIIRQAIDACLEGRGGEVSARSRAAELGRAYLVFDEEGKKRFLGLLARDYGVDNVEIEKVIEDRSRIESAVELQDANENLRQLLEPPRTRLLRQFNELTEGVKFLVDLRAELLAWAKGDSELKALDKDVHRLLASWFDIGFLDLRRITWDTPASILEKLIRYESVHAISSWKDLKNRLRDDRRCYGFFHPMMPDEPLIFVEVALVNGISGNVQTLLDVDAPVGSPDKADTAIFYSISNCQKGLAGVSFGNFLIKRVVADLTGKLSNLKTFSTLSPIPGFLNWLKKNINSLEVCSRDEELWSSIVNDDDPASSLQAMVLAVSDGENSSNGNNVRDMLLTLCARYLAEEKRGQYAYDRVAHFHLSNGAQIERINWAANLTPAGVDQSAGIMVNYLYNLSQIERNHEEYTGSGGIVVSSQVRKLLKA